MRRVRQAQIPICICGIGLGGWQATTGQAVLGLTVVAICAVAVVLALTRLRKARP